MRYQLCVMRVAVLWLLYTTLATGQRAQRSIGKGKGPMCPEYEVYDDAMEDDDDNDERRGSSRIGVVSIENASRRPYSVVCWNHREREEREPELFPNHRYEIKFEARSNVYWDCSVMSIDETAYAGRLRDAISKTFRAWSNTDYPLTGTMHGSQSGLSQPSLAVGRLCNKCYWMLKDDGIYHVWGDLSRFNAHFSLVFYWDIRGHKRTGDPLERQRQRMEVDIYYEPVPAWDDTEVDGDPSLHLTKQGLEEVREVQFRDYWNKISVEGELEDQLELDNGDAEEVALSY
jgi:hypothetical protein